VDKTGKVLMVMQLMHGDLRTVIDRSGHMISFEDKIHIMHAIASEDQKITCMRTDTQRH